MSRPNEYFGRGTHLSAVLKQDTARVRAKCPERFLERSYKESSMDGDGRVTVTMRKDTQATALSGRARHALSLKKERH